MVLTILVMYVFLGLFSILKWAGRMLELFLTYHFGGHFVSVGGYARRGGMVERSRWIVWSQGVEASADGIGVIQFLCRVFVIMT